jgi:hypothetical protein
MQLFALIRLTSLPNYQKIRSILNNSPLLGAQQKGENMITTEHKQQMRDAWSNLESEVLRRIYWRLNKESKHPVFVHSLSEIDLFKMDTFKEILIQRLEW